MKRGKYVAKLSCELESTSSIRNLIRNHPDLSNKEIKKIILKTFKRMSHITR
jgi:hypothetical protein